MYQTKHRRPAPAAEQMLPLPYRIGERVVETKDSVTLRLDPLGPVLSRFAPGQFTMLYAPGIGEIAISISGDPATSNGSLVQTIRSVGAVSAAVHDAPVGAVLGVRGPFGTGWGLAEGFGRDLVIVAGGVGLAPLRPLILGVLADRASYGDVTLIVGARTPAEFLFADQLRAWTERGDLDVEVTIDRPAEGWDGPIGFVTEPLSRLAVDPARAGAYLCGPEPMMRFCARVLLGKGLPTEAIEVSLERNMRCGVGRCGHCQLGPLLVCRDGPVIGYALAGPLLTVEEL